MAIEQIDISDVRIADGHVVANTQLIVNRNLVSCAFRFKLASRPDLKELALKWGDLIRDEIRKAFEAPESKILLPDSEVTQ